MTMMTENRSHAVLIPDVQPEVQALCQWLQEQLSHAGYDLGEKDPNQSLSILSQIAPKHQVINVDTVLVVLSAIATLPETTQTTIDEALRYQKQLVLVCQDESIDFPSQWASATKCLVGTTIEQWEETFPNLRTTLETQQEKVQAHTDLLLRAVTWQKKNRPNTLLLRADELAVTEHWTKQFPTDGPLSLTSEQQEFLQTCRQKNRFFDAFISYGRADSKAFAFKLYDRLTEAGYKVWFDQNDIPLGVDFQDEINAGIERADNFLFIIAPHSVNSIYCGREIDLALKCKKRILPLLHVEQISQETWQQRNPKATSEDWQTYKAKGLHSSFPNIHPEIGKINWVYFREAVDDFEASATGLIQIFQRHQEYVHQHTVLLDKALNWRRNRKESRYLLTGDERNQAEAWLRNRFTEGQPPCSPSDLHCEFIAESIKNADNLMTQVFLVYDFMDAEIAQKIRLSLWRATITVQSSGDDRQIGQDWQKAIEQGIEQADNLIYLLAPEAAESTECQHALKYALAMNKRIIPLLVRPIAQEQVPQSLRSMTYIDLTDNVQESDYKLDESNLLRILQDDATYYETHKVLLTKALKWERQYRNPSILLQGHNRRRAEAWLEVAQGRSQHRSVPLQTTFITESLQQPPATSLNVFLNYSRTDSDFVRKLNDNLQIQGMTTWFDQESIDPGIDFQQEIYRGIEMSENMLVVISPESLQSPYCQDELAYAQSLNKRIVTVLHHPVDEASLPLSLAKIQWIDFSNPDQDFLTCFGELVRTLARDPDHVKTHTRLVVKASEWEQFGQDDGFLLRGKDLAIAENWFQTSADKTPTPTDLQRRYIRASRELPYRKINVALAAAASVVSTLLTMFIRVTGIMQPVELYAYDRLLTLRPSEPKDDRFLVIEVDEASTAFLKDRMIKNTYQPGIGTIPDQALAETLNILQAHQPRLVALDFYRDFPAQPALKPKLSQMSMLLGICKAGYQSTSGGTTGVIKPPEIPEDRIGFNDVPTDNDTFIRRHYLSQNPDPVVCNARDSLGLLVARRYLELRGVEYTSPWDDKERIIQDMRFGPMIIPQLYPGNSTAYHNPALLKGYNTLLNYRAYQGDPNQFVRRVSLVDILNRKVPDAAIRDKIVLIGYVDFTDRNADYWKTPYAEVPGVILHAQMASQLISAVLDQRSLIYWWPREGEFLWVLLWAFVGGGVTWWFVRPGTWLTTFTSSLVILVATSYGLLAFQGAWVPLIPATASCFLASAGVVVLNYRRRHPSVNLTKGDS